MKKVFVVLLLTMIMLLGAEVGTFTSYESERTEINRGLNLIDQVVVKAGAFAYLDTITTTTITTANVYQAVNGTFVNGVLEGFEISVNDSSIVYTGETTARFEIIIACEVEGDSNGMVVSIGIKINGVLQAESGMSTFLKTLNEPQFIGNVGVPLLETGDSIQLVCTADGNGDVIKFDKFHTTIKRFFN